MTTVTPVPVSSTSVPIPTEGLDPSIASPGMLGFVIFLALGIAVLLLVRSMNRHLKKINFDDGSTMSQVKSEPTNPAGLPE
jgi:hypothetical protein